MLVITCFTLKELHKKCIRIVVIHIQEMIVHSKEDISAKKGYPLISNQKRMIH